MLSPEEWRALMRKVVMFALVLVAFGLVGDTASAGITTLRGIYGRSVLGADCIDAGGTP